jgi:hypothetical protein
MADAYTVSRLGEVNAAGGDADALFLKKFSGEVLASYLKKTAVLDKHQVRTIENGKSAQFPLVWKTTSEYHTPGNEIDGNAIKHNERVIYIDDLNIAHAFIASIDEAKNHYEVRSEYSRSMGEALANGMDVNVFRVGINAARQGSTFWGSDPHSDLVGGTALTDENMSDTISTLISNIFTAAGEMDEKNVPDEDRFLYVKPVHYYTLISNKDAINRDWGGMGSYAEGSIFKIAGFNIVKTNNLPTTDYAGVTGENNTYSGDFTPTVALAMHRGAVGTVRLIGLAVETDYQVERQGTLMVAKQSVGHGILRPEGAVEFRTGAPS